MLYINNLNKNFCEIKLLKYVKYYKNNNNKKNSYTLKQPEVSYMNTNYNNSLSFQAKVQLNARIKDGRRLMQEIAPLFEEKTAKYPGERLQITRNNPGDALESYLSFHLSKEKVFDEYRVSVTEPDIEQLMGKYDNETVADKLYKIFKCLKRETTYDNHNRILDYEIGKVQTVINRQMPLIRRYKDQGKDIYAKPFETIVARNQEKIDKINKEKEREAKQLVTDLDKIAQNDADIALVPQGWREVFNFLGN